MNAENLAPPTKTKAAAPKNGEAKAPKVKKEPTVRKSNFSKLYPDNAKLTLLAKDNPKKQGSKSRARFEGYTGAKTVADALKAGVTYPDIAYDVGHGHVKVEAVAA